MGLQKDGETSYSHSPTSAPHDFEACVLKDDWESLWAKTLWRGMRSHSRWTSNDYRQRNTIARHLRDKRLAEEVTLRVTANTFSLRFVRTSSASTCLMHFIADVRMYYERNYTCARSQRALNAHAVEIYYNLQWVVYVAGRRDIMLIILLYWRLSGPMNYRAKCRRTDKCGRMSWLFIAT